MKIQTISNLLFASLWYINWGVALIVLFSLFVTGSPFSSFGILAGQISIQLLWVVSTPGILKRFRVTGLLQQVQIVLMKSRRRLGVLTFLLMSAHALWVRLLVDIRSGFADFVPSLSTFERFGLIGLLLLVPLFVTSNNYSVRLLKKNWTRIHALIYISMWAIAIHVSLQDAQEYAIPTFAVAVLQIISWIYFIATKQKNTSPPTPNSSTPITNPTNKL